MSSISGKRPPPYGLDSRNDLQGVPLCPATQHSGLEELAQTGNRDPRVGAIKEGDTQIHYVEGWVLPQSDALKGAEMCHWPRNPLRAEATSGWMSDADCALWRSCSAAM
jgi:hypothetical protein